MKSLITIENYELHALDYVEGTLNPDMQAAFESFLAVHPEIAEELEGLGEAMLDADAAPVMTFDADSLKMDIKAHGDINATNAEEFFIREAEGELSALEVNALDQFVASNPSLERDRKLFLLTKLEADASLVYPANDLKKPIPLWGIPQTNAFRIAAGIAIIIGIASVFFQFDEQGYQPREGGPGFAEIEIPSRNLNTRNVAPAAVEDVSQDQMQEPQPMFAEAVSTPNPSRVNRGVGMDKLKARSFDQPAKSGELAHRQMEAFEPELVAWNEPEIRPSSPNRSNIPELTLGQYLGREVLGKDPDLTARAFVSDEVQKAIDKSTMVNASGDDSKRTFQLLAGVFEFKRVDYKN